MTWTKIKSDSNGNSRHVCGYGLFLTAAEVASPTLRDKYAIACARANKLGGRKYHTKAYGGGIVFTALPCELADLEKRAAEIVRKEGNNFEDSFDPYACVGDSIETTVNGIRYVARIVFDEDTHIDSDDCHDATQTGLTTAQKRQIGAARNAWKRDEWFYCGVQLNAFFDGLEIVDDIAGPALWGIECNYPKGDNSYLTEVANELLPEAKQAAGAALARFQSVPQSTVDKCKLAFSTLVEAAAKGLDQSATSEGLANCEAIAAARSALASLEGRAE